MMQALTLLLLLLLGGLLRLGRVSQQLRQVSEFLLQNLTLLLIPFIAGIVAQLDRLDHQWLPFIAACVGGASLSLLATALTLRWMLQRQAQQRSKRAAPTAGDQA